uniref:BPTI/Kunitz inhibitor domain-containing protein n=1 Tax=Gouania willdenowi TaxID=441366 RepID=A0A8C5D865_GOUWI
HQTPPPHVCSLTSDPGPCRAAFTMFYYNVQTHSCVPFIYGGCRGNDNRFDTEEECLTRCHGNGNTHTHTQRLNY